MIFAWKNGNPLGGSWGRVSPEAKAAADERGPSLHAWPLRLHREEHPQPAHVRWPQGHHGRARRAAPEGRRELRSAGPASTRRDSPEGPLPLQAPGPPAPVHRAHGVPPDVAERSSRAPAHGCGHGHPHRLLARVPAAAFPHDPQRAGDVSRGQEITYQNYYEIFDDLLTPEQMEGLKELLRPSPTTWFNQTNHRLTVTPSEGVACLSWQRRGSCFSRWRSDAFQTKRLKS